MVAPNCRETERCGLCIGKMCSHKPFTMERQENGHWGTAGESGPGLTVLKISFVSGSGTNLPQGADSHKMN